MCTTSMHRWKQGKAILLETQVFKILLAWINFININNFHFFYRLHSPALGFWWQFNQTANQTSKWRFDYVFHSLTEGKVKELPKKLKSSKPTAAGASKPILKRNFAVSCYHNYIFYLQITLMSFWLFEELIFREKS